MRGRKPVPTKIKELTGNPGKRPLNRNEPKPNKLAASAPAFLDEDARAEWDRLYADMEAIGLITCADLAVFAAYCQAFSRWVKAERKVNELGAMVKSPVKGTPMQNPYLAIANHAMKLMLDAASRLGFDPSSRSRVHVVDKSTDDNPYARLDESA